MSEIVSTIVLTIVSTIVSVLTLALLNRFWGRPKIRIKIKPSKKTNDK